MSSEWDPDTLFDVFGCETTRAILALASVKQLPAKDMANRLDVSGPTVYRRLDVLEQYDLVTEKVRIDDRGNHYSTYETNVESLTFEIENGEFTVDLEVKHDLVDQFEQFWTGLGGEN